MRNNKYWFSLIEVIIAIWILTVWVFWVYKLIWSNMLLLWNSENNLTLNSLNLPFKECLKSIWYNSLSWSYSLWDEFSINFWNDNLSCLTWSYSSWFNFTPVKIDNQEYYMFAKVYFKSSDYIKFETNIYSPNLWYLFNSWSSITSDYKYFTLYK